MEALIEHGEEWMEPLMELRDVLAASRDDRDAREEKRRDGTVKEGVLGPYKPFFRAEILKMLLEAQKEIQEYQPDMNLINYQELVAIQVLWHRDNIFNFNVSDIYKKVYGISITLEKTSEKFILERKLLKAACNDEEFKLVNELLALQKSKTILMNNRGLQNDIENRLNQFILERTIG